MRRFNNVFFKLFATFLLIVLLSFLFNGFVSTSMFRNDLRHNLKSSLGDNQTRIVDFIVEAHRKGWGKKAIVDGLQLGIGNQDRVYVVYGKDGKVLYTVGSMPKNVTVDQTMVESAIAGKTTRTEVNRNNRKLFVSAAPIGDGSLDEKAIVIVSLGFERDFHRFFAPILNSLLVTLALAAILFLIVSRRMTMPLKEMSRIALQFAKGNFSRRVGIRSRDEIGQLAMSLNQMADGLASLENLRRDFLANVSHDLRSPITSIHGFLTAILDGTIPPEKERHYLLMIKDSADRMMKLVSDLLDVARIEAGQFEIHPEPFNLNEQIRKTVASMEPQLVQHGAEVEMDSPEEDVWVLADPDRIDQVMNNLLQNALHYSPLNSRITIAIRCRDGSAQVCVKDRGIGLKEEEKAHIWDRFYKGDKARSRKVGTGIGLSIVKHILDRHGSEIIVDSEYGTGTSFIFTLRRHFA